MTTAQMVETSVTNNSSFQNYSHPDDHTTRTTVLYLLAELIQYIFSIFSWDKCIYRLKYRPERAGRVFGSQKWEQQTVFFLLRDRYSSPISSASLL